MHKNVAPEAGDFPILVPFSFLAIMCPMRSDDFDYIGQQWLAREVGYRMLRILSGPFALAC